MPVFNQRLLPLPLTEPVLIIPPIPPRCSLQVWMPVFNQCMIGVAFFHLTMVAILAVKESVGAPIAVAILWIFDLMFL